MQRYIRHCTWVYVIMVAMTLITWAIGTMTEAGLRLSLLVLAFALVKGQLVGDFFMGLRTLKGIWRWVVFVWLFVPGILITMAFAFSSGKGT